MWANKIKIVSFDMDGTLVERGYVDSVWLEGIPKLYAEKEGISFEEARAYVEKEYKKVGEERLEWYDINYWLKKFGLNCSWKKLLRKYAYMLRTYPDVKTTLENLGKEYEMIIISNASNEFISVEMEVLKLGGKFSNVFSTVSDFKKTKKDEEVYHEICRVLDIKGNEIAHVGDNWNFDYVAPSKAGINAFYLDREGKMSGKHVVKNLREFEEKLNEL